LTSSAPKVGRPYYSNSGVFTVGKSFITVVVAAALGTILAGFIMSKVGK
jgi:hypothetical protein